MGEFIRGLVLCVCILLSFMCLASVVLSVYRVSDLRSRGRGFESRPSTRRKISGQVSQCASVTKQYGTGQRAVMPCGWGVKAGMVCVRVAGKTVIPLLQYES